MKQSSKIAVKKARFLARLNLATVRMWTWLEDALKFTQDEDTEILIPLEQHTISQKGRQLKKNIQHFSLWTSPTF